MRIGELARRTGVSERSLRYYETQGLLHPGRTAAGHREYATDDEARVLIIQELYAAGFCSSVVRELLPELLGPRADGGAALAERFAAARRRLEGERREIDRQLAELHQLQLLHREAGPGSSACP